MEFGHYYSYFVSLEDRQIGYFASYNAREELVDIRSCTPNIATRTLKLSPLAKEHDIAWIEKPVRVFVLSSHLFNQDPMGWPASVHCAAELSQPVDDNEAFILAILAFRLAVRGALAHGSYSARIPMQEEAVIRLPTLFFQRQTNYGTPAYPHLVHFLKGQVAPDKLREFEIKTGRFSCIRVDAGTAHQLVGPITLNYDFHSSVLTVYFKFVNAIIIE
jgi:hypothetical protein